MRYVAGLVLAAIFLLSSPAQAQRGQQIFDLFLQGAQQEVYRQQQLQFEQQQRQELKRLHQQFVAQWQTCHAGDVAGCDAALSYPHVSYNDRQVLFTKRAAILATQQEAAQRAHREQQAAERAQRERIEAVERQRADEIARQTAVAAWQKRVEEVEQEKRATEVKLREEQSRQHTAMLLWGGALLLTVVAVAILLFVFRRYLPLERLRSAWPAALAVLRRKPASSDRKDNPAVEAPPPPRAADDKPRDTPGAIAALELALAYIEEVRDADRPRLDDVAERKHQLNTLALAAKQLDLARGLDPDAILEATTDEVEVRFSINELKAEALLLEGTTHQLYDIKRAIPALVAATQLDPNNPRAFYVLGLTHAANMNRAKAVAAFEQAVALDPKNIAYRKELNRVQNVSGAEIAAYRATRAGEKVFDASVTTWNIFAIVWNIATFPLRIVVGIFRVLRLHPFA